MKEKILAFLKEDGLTIAIVLALVIAWVVLRTPGDTFASTTEVQTYLSDGRPTVIEFYSNRCSICLASKPKVDQLERDIAGQADVLRLNVKDATGQQLAYQWQVTGVPTFFVFDGNGEVSYRRAGAPKVPEIKNVVTELTGVGMR